MHCVGLGPPTERHCRRAATVEDGPLCFRVEGDPTTAPINVLVVEVKPPPLAARFPVNKAGSEWLRTPIALLNDAHLSAIGRDGATHYAGRPDVADTKTHPDDQHGRRNTQDYARSDSHGIEAAAKTKLSDRRRKRPATAIVALKFSRTGHRRHKSLRKRLWVWPVWATSLAFDHLQ